MGIANPVTRETYGTGTHYHMQLAKQLGDMLQAPLEVGVNVCVSRFSHLYWLISNTVYNSMYVCLSFYHSVLSQERGGMMALTEVYCLVNRARGMEVNSIYYRSNLSGHVHSG